MIRTALILATLTIPAHAAEKEHVYRDRFCGGAGMQMEVRLSNGTRADCVSGRLAIEVEFSDKIYQALGQAMSYSASTGHAPAIILVCRKKPKRCDVQYQRLEDAAVHWKIPLTVWRCRTSDIRLADCPREDLGVGR